MISCVEVLLLWLGTGNFWATGISATEELKPSKEMLL